MIAPSRDDFLRHARSGRLVPIRREILFDADTAVTAYAKLTRPPFGFLLESVEGGEAWARYTFLGTEPHSAWRLDAGRHTRRWTADAGWDEPRRLDDPLDELATLIRARDTIHVPGMPRFIGGAVGYLGYDAVRYMERLPDAPADDRGLPEALFCFTNSVLAIDNLYGRAHAITLVETADADDAELERRYDAGVGRLDAMLERLAHGTPPAPLTLNEEPLPELDVTGSIARADFEQDVARIQQYITAGDAFQVVLSQRLTTHTRARPFDLYRALRSLNPSPYLFFLELDGLSLVGSSPEALVRLEEGRVTVRPIAGTRARGRDEAHDAELALELSADEKERAEHLMLVDLGRNDVGRVSRFGSVEVTKLMTIEKYSHVLHLVSQVEGELRDDLDAVDVLRACFPAGTVSGAPKIRAMEIIDELEPVRRGPYAGAAGYIAYGGRTLDTAIAIRTLAMKDGVAWVQAGAGVVADSVPAKEYQETLDKAGALVKVLRMVGATVERPEAEAKPD